jgi:vitamin B12 transporter
MPGLKPEKSQTYEIGLQHQYKPVTTRVVYFYRKIRDGVDFNNISFQYFNFTKQTVHGIELEIKVMPARGLIVTANSTYIKPKEESQSRITFKDSAYGYLIKRPAFNFNIAAGYQFDNGLYIRASGKYAGKHYDVGSYQEADVLLNGYFILGAYAEYKFKNYVKLFADLQNLTGKKFFDIRGYNSIPFLISAGITFLW